MKKIIMVLIICCVFGFSLTSCNFNLTSGSVTDVIVSETIDAFGYTLGMLAAKDPVLKAEIENYYKQLTTQGLTITLLNQALVYLGAENVGYKILAYKLTRLIKVIGGQFDNDGMITDLGQLTQEHLEIGKQAYLMGLMSGV